MKKKIIFLLLLLTPLLATSVSAYTFLGGKHSKTNLRVVVKSGTKSKYEDFIYDAARDWSNTPTKINMSVYLGGGGDIYFGGDNYGNTDWNARCTNFREYIWYGDYTTSSIEMNYDLMDSRSNLYNTATINHELGHALGLDHVDDSYQIMYHTGNPARKVYTPQSDDIDGVNALYGK
ncbi:matrixin family metalloprotease [Paenibacillus thiaminolyticus]|nr:matrixin family metalloprotease [Paenibacillus thiaminolyticus]MCY9533553.1 matrixin family metalloprotease [Paenibacillus thiaminolyticus]MCY9600775.1 matrixin family metalloprotease [Paenibacillus thiaminolyticus]MCY9607603.1 matrixin family metalloprotease [Paenibacillus thiaminolyticus]MCY9611403.1 matrixin family metalloprotease [Paenibacillus thiaminolyticus]MCY9617326.1 matrixin family metalloprotease [Paenibacillus thiaminolyticus]